MNELRHQREKVILAITEAHPTFIALNRRIQRLGGELAELNKQVRDLPSTQR